MNTQEQSRLIEPKIAAALALLDSDMKQYNARFKTIVADPPWAYKNRMRGNMTKGEMRSVDFNEYPTMSVDDICTLPVRDLAADDSHLYLWTTQTFLRYAYQVLDAWGFRQGAMLVWSKPPKGVCGTYVCSVEFCIFARKGNLAHKRRQLGTCFQWPRSGHSAKPEAFLDMVESVSPGPYLELFARRNRLGWATWGNESLCHVDLGAKILGGSKELRPVCDTSEGGESPTCCGLGNRHEESASAQT